MAPRGRFSSTGSSDSRRPSSRHKERTSSPHLSRSLSACRPARRMAPRLINGAVTALTFQRQTAAFSGLGLLPSGTVATYRRESVGNAFGVRTQEISRVIVRKPSLSPQSVLVNGHFRIGLPQDQGQTFQLEGSSDLETGSGSKAIPLRITRIISAISQSTAHSTFSGLFPMSLRSGSSFKDAPGREVWSDQVQARSARCRSG